LRYLSNVRARPLYSQEFRGRSAKIREIADDGMEEVVAIGCTNLRGYLSGLYIFDQSMNRRISFDNSKNNCQIKKLYFCLYSGTENAKSSHTGTTMGNNIERFGELEIQWIGVPEIPGCGHGVEFHYRTGNHGKQSYNGRGDGKIIGFMEGLGWLDKDGSPVKVYFLSSDSREWGMLLTKARQILKGLKECVSIVLEEKVEPGQIWHGEIIKANIFTCWNC
jgi:hypothetical protein